MTAFYTETCNGVLKCGENDAIVMRRISRDGAMEIERASFTGEQEVTTDKEQAEEEDVEEIVSESEGDATIR